MYKIVIEHRTTKETTRIPKDQMGRIAAVIRGLAINPRPEGSKRIVGELGIYRIRSGDYRVLYEINESAKEIRILRIAHRKDIYR